MTPRASWKTWGRALTLAASVGACEGNSPGPGAQPGPPAEPVVADAPRVDPKEEPGEEPRPGREPGGEPGRGPGGEPTMAAVEGTLNDRPVQTEVDGPWTRRRVGGGAGGGAIDLGEGLGSVRGLSGSGSGGRGYGGGGVASVGAAPGSAAPPKAMKRAPADADAGMSVKESGPKQGPLKAGSTDDNADYKGYLKFLASWVERAEVRGQFQPLDVEGRAFVRVLDGDGRPVPGARVEIRDPARDAPIWQATTYGDGRAPYYPRVFGAQQQPPSRLAVRATAGGEAVEGSWDGAGELTLRTAGPRVDGPMALDVLFLIDTTGSMGDEIDQIKTSLLAVTGKARARRADLMLRYGAVLYRDLNDEYLTMAHPFTADLEAFNGALQGVTAGGGGDLPEALNQGLERAVAGMQWQPDAAKVVFLICDAPPQMRVKGDVLYGDSALRAVGMGLRIHSVAASGLDPLGTLVLRQIAQLTRGKFIFIEYGGTQASAARHGVSGPVQGGNNLDDILLAQITAEIDGWGR